MLFKHFTWFPFQDESLGTTKIHDGESQSSYEMLSSPRGGDLGKDRGKQEG